MRDYKNYLDYVKSIDRDELAECAGCAKERAGALIAYAMEKAHGFSVFDFAILKICLLTFGLWLGAQFSKFFGKFKVFLFAGFFTTWVYLFWRVFLRDNDWD